jgi:transcriptional regulator with XRE-family HTH domain
VGGADRVRGLGRLTGKLAVSDKRLLHVNFDDDSLVSMKLASSPKERRKRAGEWLKKLREKAGLTQIELADRLGFKYYAFVSQIERGYGRVPTDKIVGWAEAVGTEPRPFAQRLISYYEPELHRVLYEPLRERGAPSVVEGYSPFLAQEPAPKK